MPRIRESPRAASRGGWAGPPLQTERRGPPGRQRRRWRRSAPKSRGGVWWSGRARTCDLLSMGALRTRVRVALGGERRIGDVGRGVAVRPVVDLVGKVRPRVRADEGRDIERLFVGQRTRLVERHVLPDARRTRADSRHPRADAAGPWPPQAR